MVVCGILAAALLVVMYEMPAPYVIELPGPAFNTLGKTHGKKLLEVSGHKTYPTTGALDMLTVGVEGGPGTRLALGDVVQSWIDPHNSVVPEEAVYAPGSTSKQVKRQNAAEMSNSQQSAVAAALTNLDKKYKTTLTIGGLSPDSPSRGKLKDGDVLKRIGDTPIKSLSQLKTELNKIGKGGSVRLAVDRHGSSHSATVTPEHTKSGVQLGVFVNQKFTFPFTVKIRLQNVGGPSAGMMFALGIIDTITPGPMTGGHKIAGTGTISPDGQVGPIGGIRQKMFGAKHGGANWFLAPKSNCEEVAGHVPSDLRVVKVSTLSDARHAVEAIASGKNTDALPSCSSGKPSQ
nr:S16 family serine protease [Spelaeicoccus albus]